MHAPAAQSATPHAPVAQTVSLPYRRLAVGAALGAQASRRLVQATSYRPLLAGIALAALLALTGCAKPDDAAPGTPPPRAADPARCAPHNAPAALCFICDARLRDPDRLWCREHDRYEDRCWLCHPELRDAQRPFCEAHGLYEDECFLCRPELKNARLQDQAAAAQASAAPATVAQTVSLPNRRLPVGAAPVAQASNLPVQGASLPRNAGGSRPSEPADQTSAPPVLMCAEHRVPEAECGICHPELVTRLAPGASVKVRLPAAVSAAQAGVQTALPEVGDMSEGIECFAELVFNQNRLAQIVAPVGGIVQDVAVDLGSRVEENQVVARLWSATIAEAVARAVLTHQTLERERRLRAERVTSEQDLQRAEAEHRAACQHARTLGFSEADIDAFGTRPDEPVYLEVRAPFAGEIIERSAVRGALIEAGRPLFTLADRATLWAMLNIPEAALDRVREGQPVELRVDALPGRTFTGRLTWIAPEVDERTRLVRARAEVPNPDGRLRARMFARARILTRQSQGALVLPDAALQRVDGRPVVFVQRAEDLFEARAVRLGAKRDGRVEILEGLDPREPVVVAGGFALKSQLLVSRLGAACAEE